jgi:hypothetical protein
MVKSCWSISAGRWPAPPGLFVLHDGMGLSDQEAGAHPQDPLRIRIIFVNPLYKHYECSSEEIDIIGRIQWFAREM